MIRLSLNALRRKKKNPPASKARPALNEQAITPTFSTDRGINLKPNAIANAMDTLDAGDFSSAASLFSQMEEKYLHLAAVMQARISSAPFHKWEVLPGKKRSERKPDAKAMAMADFAADALNYLDDFETILSAIQRIGLGYGASMTEIYWKVNNGAVTIDRLEVKSARYLTYIDSENPETLLDFPRWVTTDNPEGKALDRKRFFHYTPMAAGDHPVRSGLYRGILWYWLFSNFTLKDWLTFNEVFGQPLRVGKYPASASDQEREALRQAVQGLGVDASAVIPENMLIEIVEAAKKGHSTYQPAAAFFNAEVSKRVLSQTLTTEMQGSSSSLAMAKVHERKEDRVAGADARKLMEAFTRDVIVPLIDFNFGEQEVYPYLHFPIEAAPDALAELELEKKLRELGYRRSLESLQEVTGLALEETAPEQDKDARDGGRAKDKAAVNDLPGCRIGAPAPPSPASNQQASGGTNEKV